jgi:hypothetical protein
MAKMFVIRSTVTRRVRAQTTISRQDAHDATVAARREGELAADSQSGL